MPPSPDSKKRKFGPGYILVPSFNKTIPEPMSKEIYVTKLVLSIIALN